MFTIDGLILASALVIAIESQREREIKQYGKDFESAFVKTLRAALESLNRGEDLKVRN